MSALNAAQLAPIDDFDPKQYAEDVRDREGVRYLFFPGDVISEARKEEREDLRAGGDEIGSRCLVRTKGFLRRCRITPLERWVELMPRELMPEGVTPVNMLPTSASKGSEQGFTSFDPNLYGFGRFPGEEVRWITYAAHAGGRKGIVELTELFDIEWEDFDRSGLQKEFFPDFPYVPPTLSGVEALIRAHTPREMAIGRKLVRTGVVQSQMLVACSQFRRWATTRIEAENLLLKIGTTKDGWTYTYSGLAEVLFPQLEMARADDYMHDQAKFQRKLGESQEAIAQLLQEARKDGDRDDLILELSRQFDERMQSMMRQNQEFVESLLTKLFTIEREGADEAPEQSKPPRKSKPKGDA